MSAELSQVNQIGNRPSLFGGLSRMEAAFVDYYIADPTGNAAEAARRAGYKDSTESGSDALYVTGSRLLRRTKVQQEIKRRLGKHILSADEVLESLTNHAKSDIAEVLEPDGSFNLRKARKRGKSALLRKLKVKKFTDKDGQEHVEHEFELHDAQAALVHLGKFHALFTEKTQQEASLTPESIELIGQSLLTAMQEAAARKRLGEGSRPVIDVTPE